MRGGWAGCLSLTLAGWSGLAVAQSPPAPRAVTLGTPVGLGEPLPAPRPVVRGQMPDPVPPPWTPVLPAPVAPAEGDGLVIAPLAVPRPPGPLVTTASASSPAPAPAPAADAFGPVNPAAAAPVIYPPTYEPVPVRETAPDSTYRDGGSDRRGRRRREHKSLFGDWFHGNGEGGGCFQSDHCFDFLASPVSNPFLFEDPRSLTEVRPLFFFQTIPNNNWLYRGGHAEFYGLQARVAVTERWSVVFNKIGGVSINPGDGSAATSETGFAELWLGPKFTFIRNEETGTVAAAGVTFAIPTGPPAVFQDTGKLSVIPYVTVAQNFLNTQFGSFNAMDTAGYSFRADGQRSDYFFNSLHLDYDILNRHKFYPLLELNWFYYTRSGTANALGFEGRDLANIGSTGVNNRNNLSLAAGFRYKFSEHAQLGLAAEFPLNGTRDLLNFRLGVDFIFRY